MFFTRLNCSLFVFALVFLLTCFFPVLSHNFSHHDDWYTFAYDQALGQRKAAHFGEHPVFEIAHQIARPGSARIFSLWSMLTEHISDLRFVRAGSIVLISAVVVLLTHRLRMAGLSLLHAFPVALGVFLLPGAVVYVSIATCFGYCLALLLAAVAGFLADGFLYQPVSLSWKLAYLQSLLGTTALVFLSLAIYPPAAMFFLLVSGIPVVLKHPSGPATLPAFLRLLAFCLAIFVFYFVCYKYILSVSSGTGLYAFQLLSFRRILDKLYFFDLVTYEALNLWAIRPSSLIALSVGLTILLGWAINFAKQSRDARGEAFKAWLFEVVAVIIVVNAPIFASAANYAPPRVIFSYVALLSLLFLFAARHLCHLLGDKAGSALWLALVLVGLCVQGTVVHNNILRGFAAAGEAQYQFLSHQLMLKKDQGFREVEVILSRPGVSIYGEPVSDIEYGYAATLSDVLTSCMIDHAANELGYPIVWRLGSDKELPNAIDLGITLEPPAFVYWPFIPLLLTLGCFTFVFGSRHRLPFLYSDRVCLRYAASSRHPVRVVFRVCGLGLLFVAFFWLTALGVNAVTVGSSIVCACLFVVSHPRSVFPRQMYSFRDRLKAGCAGEGTRLIDGG